MLGKQIEKDQGIDLLRVFTAQGHDALTGIWETYSDFYPDKRVIKDHQGYVTGWTSWYNHYGDVSEGIIRENIEALQQHAYPIDIFQMDDGFQTAIGDWLSIREKFPSGMKAVATSTQGSRPDCGWHPMRLDSTADWQRNIRIG
ncbi:hypothetical protein G6F51_013866 [Rhizopus arrhizus]|uniref:alpha-galactosidase n=1 Tax=Rhizopus oryzae TaxID=64495 RepID=A0A9P7C0N5_RHIOR|nr:hypothetical protein G6F51_013866 [Rhizopus arrhizus]